MGLFEVAVADGDLGELQLTSVSAVDFYTYPFASLSIPAASLGLSPTPWMRGRRPPVARGPPHQVRSTSLHESHGSSPPGASVCFQACGRRPGGHCSAHRYRALTLLWRRSGISSPRCSMPPIRRIFGLHFHALPNRISRDPAAKADDGYKIVEAMYHASLHKRQPDQSFAAGCLLSTGEAKLRSADTMTASSASAYALGCGEIHSSRIFF